MPTYQDLGYAAPAALPRDRARAVFGQVMGLVALTVGCTALGAYVGRNLTGSSGIFVMIGAFGCMFALGAAARRGREQLATGLLFAMGLLLGIAVGPILAYYAKAQPAILWQAAGSTAGFVAILGSYGYATRRDLSHWARALFWSLIALIVAGIVLMFASIPHAHIVYCVAGLGVFGAFTVFDFNRLRRASMDAAVMIAAGIFLDIFNVFLFMLRLFGGGRD
ncbi:MAG TPA: Bax inhibitor-1/YccA family protein [Solirubrobacteraceae bacterium]|nr:Bax inhibitor-1/YccA family protein [Solirubrobacteraceae bacterium]